MTVRNNFKEHKRIVAKNIKSKRRKLKLTQEELAEKANITIWTVRNIESRSRYCDPYFSTICAIADVLNCSIDELRSV